MKSVKAFCEDHLALAKLVLIGLVVQLLVIGYVFYSGYQTHANNIRNQRAGCERNKQDRADSAAFQTAQTVYINKVTGAASVKEDVKRAAREARKTFDRTSASLTARSKIDCKKAFPDATLFP
jgi:hypothetical protein